MRQLLQDIHEKLLHLMNTEVSALYGTGPLGAQNIYKGNNKCMVCYRICEFPKSRDNKKRLEALRKNIGTEEELKLFKKLEYLYTEYERVYRQIYMLEERLQEINWFINEKRRFDGFKYNQNIFDNTISILKIINKYEMYFDKKISAKPNFDSAKKDTNNLDNFINNIICNYFKNINLFYNINGLVSL